MDRPRSKGRVMVGGGYGQRCKIRFEVAAGDVRKSLSRSVPPGVILCKAIE